MSNNKNKKRVYSKPVVEKPVEEKIEEITEEVIEAKAVDPEVFETKLFVEEEPEEFVEITGEEEIVEEPEEIKIEQHIEGEKLAEVLEANHNIDAVAELEKVLQSEGADQLGVEYSEDFKPEDHPDAITLESHTESCVCEEPCTEPCTCVAPTLEEQPNQGCIDTPELEDILTPEQEEEGAQVIADMVNNSILEELKALAPEPPAQKTIASLSNAELRHFHRTGQMPR
jgi:hypothetical protein